MRKFIIFMIILILSMNYLPKNIFVEANEAIHVSASQAVLMDQQTGRVIYEKDGHMQRPVASITKVMTALLAIEYGNLQDEVHVSERAITTEGSSIYLQINEQMTLEDLLYGLMLRSGNDAAVAIAEHIAGSVEGFAFLMNEKARYLGMTNTQFMNSHGLDEEGHYSSAFDIALLMRHAMENEKFQEISRTKSYLSKNRDYKWFNKNKLLTHLYPHSTGGKTGFTKKAGRTLVTTAKKNELSLIAVTLHAPNDWNDHIQLYETYFEKMDYVLLEKKGKRKIAGTREDSLSAFIEEPVSLALQEEEVSFLNKEIRMYKYTDGDVIGKIAIKVGDETILTVPLYEQANLFDQMNALLKKIARNDGDG